MSKKKSSYECFLERCSRKFWSHEERRDHCVKTHQFPADFKFDEARKNSASTPRQNSGCSQLTSTASRAASVGRGGSSLDKGGTGVQDMEIEDEFGESVVVKMREGE